MGETITIPYDKILSGINLCLDQAKRLNEGAEKLLSLRLNGLAYSLWSLAVEEFGKAIKLHQKKSTLQNKKPLTIKKSDLFSNHAHENLFNVGFQKISNNIKFRKSVQVLKNTLTRGVAFNEDSIIIPAGLTGEFCSSISSLLKPDVDWRFKELYIGWNDDVQDWTCQTAISDENLKIVNSISSHDLENAIIETKKEIKEYKQSLE